MNKFNFPHHKAYTGKEIEAIRRELKDSRPRFARRFLVDYQTIKAWENEKNPRKPAGPANVLMQQLEQLALDIRAEQNRIIEALRHGDRRARSASSI